MGVKYEKNKFLQVYFLEIQYKFRYVSRTIHYYLTQSAHWTHQCNWKLQELTSPNSTSSLDPTGSVDPTDSLDLAGSLDMIGPFGSDGIIEVEPNVPTAAGSLEQNLSTLDSMVSVFPSSSIVFLALYEEFGGES